MCFLVVGQKYCVIMIALLLVGCRSSLNVETSTGNKSSASTTNVTPPVLTSSQVTLSESSVSSSSISISWTAAQDDDTSNEQLQYEVRISTSNNIQTLADAELNGAIKVPYAKNLSSASITGLSPGTKYYIAVIVKDLNGNKMIYSVVSQSTSASVSTSAGNSGSGSTALSAPVLTNPGAQTFTVNVAISTVSFTNSGESATSCSVSPSLPTGLSVSAASNTCQISGTPTKASAAATYTITALAANGASGTATVNITTNCPSGWVSVPANAGLGVAQFCVMKYEAKDVSGVATSQVAGAAWVNIHRGSSKTDPGTAWEACGALGANYDLISNAQWQTIARNIEGVATNWSLGVVATNADDGNYLNVGHSDALPNQICNASVENVGADCSTSDGASPFSQKRTHTLSNNEVIWDISGNAWEWVQDENTSTQGVDARVSQITSADHTMAMWGPAGTYTAKNSGMYGGLGRGDYNYSGGAIMRGGSFGGDLTSGYAGIFSAILVYPGTFGDSNTGFRCVIN